MLLFPSQIWQFFVAPILCGNDDFFILALPIRFFMSFIVYSFPCLFCITLFIVSKRLLCVLHVATFWGLWFFKYFWYNSCFYFKYFWYNFCFYWEDFTMHLIMHDLKEFRAFTFVFTLRKQSPYRDVKVSRNSL